MSNPVKIVKEVSNVATPEAGGVYFVRVDGGFDIMVANSTGQLVKANYVKTVNGVPIDANGNVGVNPWIGNLFLTSRGQIPVAY